MRCSKCGTESLSGKKFCAECGSQLSSRCTKCGAENKPTAKFCEECGAAFIADATQPATSSTKPASATGSPQARSATLDIRVTPEQPGVQATLDGERKTVTALFADIKGSMDLMEDLDPEEARAIVDPALKLMIDAAHRYDGYVVQSTGDGIFALFGAPVAHEDHPQRSLYAALRMQEEVKRYAEKLRAEKGVNLQVRVGINTGEVVVRSITTGAGQTEYTPIGHSISLASRLQGLANPGSIAISEAVRKLAEGYFLLKPLGPARIKGVTEPVNVYEITGIGPLRTRLQRAIGRGLTKFVGREREMEALKRAAEQAKSGRGQIVAAMAEPGVGKSRLYFEFKATSQSGWMVLETFSISHGKASAYLPVIDLLRNYFDIAAVDDERKRREKVTGRVVALDRSLEDTLPYLFSLLGIVEGEDPLAQMDGQIRKRRTLEAIKRILLREWLNQPLMVIFEDLHWIDEATQELLNLLADSIGTAKILLLVNYRPEYSHTWGSKTYYTQLRLDPLGQASAVEMLSALLGDGPDLAALKDLITKKTEGNPFFMEEMVQNLLEEGALARNGEIKLTRPLSRIRVPATVQAMLAARIDRLPPDDKELLQTLAVLGREFPLGLVRHVTRKADDELERGLSRLQAGEFIYEQPAASDVEYIFKHALTQEVAHNSVLMERRQQIHERAAAAIESLFADSTPDHYNALAHHYGRSGNAQKAVNYLHLAAQQAMNRSAYAEARLQITAALELIRSLPDGVARDRIEIALLINLAISTTFSLGLSRSTGTDQILERARELCEKVGGDADRFTVLASLAFIYCNQSQRDKGRTVSTELLNLGTAAGDTEMIGRAKFWLGFSSLWTGDPIAALEVLEQTYDVPPATTSRHEITFGNWRITCRSLASLSLWATGYPERALVRNSESFAFARSSASAVDLFPAFVWSAYLNVLLRNSNAVFAQADEARQLAKEHGLITIAPLLGFWRGWALVQMGRAVEGLSEIHLWRTASTQTVAEIGLPWIFCWLGESYLIAGRAQEGRQAIAEGLTAVQSSGAGFIEAELRRINGELLLIGDIDTEPEAAQCFRDAIEVARSQGAKAWELRATISLARLLDRQGRRDQARAMLADIYGWFTEGFDTADLIDAKALLDQLSA